VKVVVLSDTHAPRRWRSCPPPVAGHLRGVDLILHAGDVCTAGVLDELAAYAPVRGRPARLRHRFPLADLVIFGHSHIPVDQDTGGQRLFNPGSPTDRRHQPRGTIGLLDIADGRLLAARIVPVT
jgi:uncharacterized protein